MTVIDDEGDIDTVTHRLTIGGEDTDDKTPGFDLILFLGAVGILFSLWKKRRI